MPLDVACSRLGTKWDDCFMEDAEEEEAAGDKGQGSVSGHKKRRSLFNKLRLSNRYLGQVPPLHPVLAALH